MRRPIFIVYEEVILGLTVVLIILVGYFLYKISRLGPKVLEARAREIEMRFKDMRRETSSLEERLDVLGKAAHDALEDYRILRQNMSASSEHSLDAFRKGLFANLEETRRLLGAVEQASGKVDGAAAEMEDRLTASVERHVGGTVGDRIKPLLDSLDKMLERLEARGASPFKTAKARILQHLMDRGDIGGKHTAWERAVECLVGHERDVGKAALDDLVRNGLVVNKPTNHGVQVSLNKERLDDVRRVINGEEL